VSEFDVNLWRGSLLGRVVEYILFLWEHSLVGRALLAVWRFFARLCAGSWPGKVWLSDWPSGRAFRQSMVGRGLLALGEGIGRLGGRLSPYFAGTWETSLFGRLWRWAARALQPLLSTSQAIGLFTGYADDVMPAPSEARAAAQVTSPVVYLLGALLGLIPLIPSNFGGVLSPTVLMIVGVWGTTLIWVCHKVMTREFRWRGSSALLPVLAMLAIFGAAALRSPLRGSSLLNFIIWTTAVLLFFLVVNVVRTSRDAAVLLGPVLVGSVLMALWAAYQLKYPPVVTEHWVDPSEEGLVRVFAGMMNPNYLAELMELWIPLGVALWLQNPRRRLLLAVPLLAMVFALFVTQSRGGWLALVLALAVFVLLRSGRYSVLFILLGLAGLAVAPRILPASVMKRVLSAFNPANTSNQYRISAWLGIWQMIKHNWILGTGLGPDAFVWRYQEYMLPTASVVHAHNTLMQVLAEAGVLGLGATLWSILAVLRRTFTVGANSRNALLIAAVPAALVGILFHSMVDHIWYNPKVLFAFWAVAGLGMGLVLGNREDAAA
jgi:putative inorganic carbon (hco3(-)) transporter